MESGNDRGIVLLDLVGHLVRTAHAKSSNYVSTRDCCHREEMTLSKLLRSPLAEIARLLVRLDHIASLIINANHSVM